MIYIHRAQIAAALLAAFSFVSNLSAAPIAVGPKTDITTTTSHVFQPDYEAWFVADLTDPVTPAPIQITTDGNAGRWRFELTFQPGAPALETGDLFLLQELLAITPGEFALDNWQQEILSPDWKWSDAVIFDNATAEPLPGLVVNLTDTLASFNFTTVPAGSELFVVKALEYVGPGAPATGSIIVQTQAVPEPGSAVLGLLGAMFFAARRPRLS